MTPVTESVVLVPNCLGIDVPKDFKEHLHQWVALAASLPREIPNSDKAVFLARCIHADTCKLPVPVELREEHKLSVLEKRMTLNKVMLSPWASLFLAGMSSNTAEVVMWSYIISVLAKTGGAQYINMGPISLMLASGVPTQDSWRTLWNFQKRPTGDALSGNLLDMVRVA